MGTEYGPAKNFIPDHKGRNVCPDGIHNAGELISKTLGKLSGHPLASGSASEQAVKRLNSRSLYPDADLARPRCRHLTVDEAQNTGRTVLVEHDCLTQSASPAIAP